MQFAELSTVKRRVQLAVPLPFNLSHADTTLLLARIGGSWRGVVGIVGESQFDKPQPNQRLLAALAA